jgi:hypothetical protein
MCFLQLNPPTAEEIRLRWMKSLRDEICLAAGDAGEHFTLPPSKKKKIFPLPLPCIDCPKSSFVNLHNTHS